jgi:hypothetical protein
MPEMPSFDTNRLIKNRLAHCIAWLNERVHPVFVLFFVILLNRLHLPLSGGEEHYLSFALQQYDPSWIPNSFTYTEFPGTRLLFQTLTGFFVHQFGFMATAIAGRLIVFVFIGFPLARLFRLFQLNNLTILIIVQGFLLTNQSFFADEWILRTFEPKAPAYVFLFWALLFFMFRQYLLMAVALAFSAWFHLLVGGWCMVGVMLVMILSRVPFKQWVSAGVLFAAMLLPLIWYLWPVLMEQVASGEKMNQVYVYFRLKHHLGLFDSYAYFVQKHLAGVIVAFLVLLVQPLLFKRLRNPMSRTLVLLNGTFLALALVFVLLAWIDMQFLDKAGSMGLTYYPFRMMSVSLFLTIVLGVVFLKEHCSGFSRWVKYLAGIALTILVVRSVVNIRDLAEDLKPDHAMEALVNAAQMVSEPGDVFLLLHPGYPVETSFGRLSQREPYVVFKYVPAGGAKLAEWHRRIGIVESLENDPSGIHPLALQEGIQFVFSRYPVTNSLMELCWHSSSYYLYRVLSSSPTKDQSTIQNPVHQIHNE